MSNPAPPEVSLAELVDDVADRTGEDPESVRTWLDPFTDDGSVRPEAIEATVTDVSQILATAETRVDLATRTVEGASDIVADVPDLEIVRVRQNAFEERLADLRSDVKGLGEELSGAANDLDSPVDIYEAAVDLHVVTTDAQRIVRVAHDLETEVEAFEAWLGSANRRRDALVDDLEAAEESAESLGEAVESNHCSGLLPSTVTPTAPSRLRATARVASGSEPQATSATRRRFESTRSACSAVDRRAPITIHSPGPRTYVCSTVPASNYQYPPGVSVRSWSTIRTASRPIQSCRLMRPPLMGWLMRKPSSGSRSTARTRSSR